MPKMPEVRRKNYTDLKPFVEIDLNSIPYK
jgi:hypothetical protein